MGKYTGILLCSDFDGTLYHQDHISAENADAIRAFQAGGGHFTMASGRYPRFFSEFADDFVTNAPVVALNGSIIYDPDTDRFLYESRLSEEAYQTARIIWEEHPFIRRIYFYAPDTAYELKRDSGESMESFLARVPRRCCKCVMVTGNGECEGLRDEMLDRYGDRYNFSRSWPIGLELQEKRDSKGEAIKRLRTIMGEDARYIVCVGDYENDISMFEAADLSFAVKGGSPLAAAAAHRITVPCAEHAIAAVVREL